jgi:hypothetical protein
MLLFVLQSNNSFGGQAAQTNFGARLHQRLLPDLPGYFCFFSKSKSKRYMDFLHMHFFVKLINPF